MVDDEKLKLNINNTMSNYSTPDSFNKDDSSDIDIDKQIWLAKQQELSECEIIQRRKNRQWYWMWKNILILLAIIALLLMIYWKEIVKWIQVMRN